MADEVSTATPAEDDVLTTEVEDSGDGGDVAIADAPQENEITVETLAMKDENGVIRLKLPEPVSIQGMELLSIALGVNNHVWGAKTLKDTIDSYIHNLKLTERQLETIVRKIANFNHERSESQVRGDRKKSSTAIATAFYGRLSTAALRSHAKLAHLNPDFYENDDELRKKLVEEFASKEDE